VKASFENREGVEQRRREILDLYEALRSANHFEVLGVSTSAGDAQVKEAYFRLAKRFHPDTHHDPHLSDLRNKIEAVFIRLGLAYEVLRNAKARAGYEADLKARAPRVPAPSGPAPVTPPADPPVDPAYEAKVAEDGIRKAEKRFAEEKYWDAIQLLEPALDKVSGKVRQRGRILLAKAYQKNPHWVKRAEEQLQEVVRDDPQCVDAYCLLGNLYKSSGLKSRALSMFRKVLELNPDHEQASTELGGLSPEPPGAAKEGGGLLKKLFGKGE
jgi:tetratricopeptide (TPR) repeat protein